MGDLWFEAQQCRENYAIAVEDDGTLFECFRIRRSPAGDVLRQLSRPATADVTQQLSPLWPVDSQNLQTVEASAQKASTANRQL
jgi:hypothetical protein